MLFLHFLVLWDCRVQHLFESRVALNTGLGGMRDVVSAIISHEQTQSNRVCCFQTLDAVLPKDLFSDYLGNASVFSWRIILLYILALKKRSATPLTIYINYLSFRCTVNLIYVATDNFLFGRNCMLLNKCPISSTETQENQYEVD